MYYQVLDVFCGIGGMSLGFQDAGFQVSAGIDWQYDHIKSFKSNFPRALAVEKDVQDISVSDLNYRCFHVLIGSSPCFGANTIDYRIEEDERNKRILLFANLIGMFKPNYFVWETTPNLIKGKHKAFFMVFKKHILSLGYQLKKPKEMIGSNFGGTNERKRVYLIGYKEYLKEPKFPKKTKNQTKVIELISNLESSDILHKPTSLYPHVKERYANLAPGKRDKISNHYRLRESEVCKDIGTTKEGGNSRKTTAKLIHPYKDRHLTLRELSRLSGLPDNFNLSLNEDLAFSQICNASSPQINKAIALEIMKCYN